MKIIDLQKKNKNFDFVTKFGRFYQKMANGK